MYSKRRPDVCYTFVPSEELNSRIATESIDEGLDFYRYRPSRMLYIETKLGVLMSTDGPFETATLSTLHHALRAARRRSVILLLTESPDLPLSVRELARQIAALEQNVPLNEATGEPYRNVYNALSQTHLPMLADAEVVIYDSDRQTVAPGEQIVAAAVLVSLGPAVIRALHSHRISCSGCAENQSTID